MLSIRPKPERPPLESEILSAIMRAVNETAYARVWRNNTGKLRDATGRVVTYGLATGSADLVGLMLVSEPSGYGSGPTDMGRFLALEVKRPGKKTTDDQDRWGAVVRGLGGIYAVVTSVEEALRVLEENR